MIIDDGFAGELAMRWFWLDRFSEFVSGQRATAWKCVSLSEDYLHDHWFCYPVMPNPLIAEGLAQAGGLLVSEAYQFRELVVLAKFSKLRFHGEARPGDQLRYQVEIGMLNEDGASVSAQAHVGERLQAEAEIFFARLNPADISSRDGVSTDGGSAARDADGSSAPRQLFDPAHLLHWLRLVKVFDVGVRADGERLRVSDYGFKGDS